MSDEKKTNAITPFLPRNVEDAVTLAGRLAMSSLLPEKLRKRPEDVLVQILTGVELGLSPMQSIRGMHVIDGKAVMSADLMVGLVLSHPDVCEWFRLDESDDRHAVYETKRRGAPKPVRLAFTIEQAKQAGLTGKGNWRTYPAAMLRARAAAALARAVYPDLTAGVYEPDEGAEIGRRSGQLQSVPVEPTPVAPVIDIAPVAVEAKPAPTPAPVVEAKPAEAPADPAQAMRETIGKAETLEALRALVPTIQALTPDQRVAVRGAYLARARELHEKARAA